MNEALYRTILIFVEWGAFAATLWFFLIFPVKHIYETYFRGKKKFWEY